MRNIAASWGLLLLLLFFFALPKHLRNIWTSDLCDASAVLHRLSYEDNWEPIVVWVNFKPVDYGYTYIYMLLIYENDVLELRIETKKNLQGSYTFVWIKQSMKTLGSSDSFDNCLQCFIARAYVEGICVLSPVLRLWWWSWGRVNHNITYFIYPRIT